MTEKLSEQIFGLKPGGTSILILPAKVAGYSKKAKHNQISTTQYQPKKISKPFSHGIRPWIRFILQLHFAEKEVVLHEGTHTNL